MFHFSKLTEAPIADSKATNNAEGSQADRAQTPRLEEVEIFNSAELRAVQLGFLQADAQAQGTEVYGCGMSCSGCSAGSSGCGCTCSCSSSCIGSGFTYGNRAEGPEDLISMELAMPNRLVAATAELDKE